VNSKVFLDGASGKDEIVGYFTADENPQSENPPSGYVYSANNQPDTIYSAADSGKGTLYPGYYVPEHRAKRILEYLNSDKEWTVDNVKEMITDVITPAYPNLATYIMAVLENEGVLLTSPNHSAARTLLKNWKGTHELDDIAPVIYYKLIYNILSNAMVDELGEETFATLVTTHMFKRSISGLINSVNSPWYDDVETETLETRKAVFTDAFDRTIRDLEAQLGPNIENWTWNRVHFIHHVHPIGKKEPFDKIFNVGPFPIKGGNAVINNTGFYMNKEGIYTCVFGPSMRIIIDFADVENSVSVIPTGQSGNVLSDYYSDQAAIYNEGTFRKQMMNREEIEGKQIGTLTFQPK
jgi:penicillin amidase